MLHEYCYFHNVSADMSSGLLQVFIQPSRNFIVTTGVACSDSVSHNRILQLACSEDWTCNLQIFVSLEAQWTNAYNRYTMCPTGVNLGVL